MRFDNHDDIEHIGKLLMPQRHLISDFSDTCFQRVSMRISGPYPMKLLHKKGLTATPLERVRMVTLPNELSVPLASRLAAKSTDSQGYLKRRERQ